LIRRLPNGSPSQFLAEERGLEYKCRCRTPRQIVRQRNPNPLKAKPRPKPPVLGVTDAEATAGLSKRRSSPSAGTSSSSVLKMMEETSQHSFQVLTKRSDRVRKLLDHVDLALPQRAYAFYLQIHEQDFLLRGNSRVCSGDFGELRSDGEDRSFDRPSALPGHE
jgi:hypothetical protein